MITPTIGRVVWFNEGSGSKEAAIVCYVHSDSMVNLVVFNANGEPEIGSPFFNAMNQR